MNGILTSLGGHRPWANPGPIDACAGWSDDLLNASAPGTVGSIRGTLAHVVANEEGDPAGHEPPPGRGAVACRGMDDLPTRPERNGRRLVSPVERTEGDPEVRGEWRGGSFAQPTPVVVIPIINHATEHRGNIASAPSAPLAAPPLLDGWTSAEDAGGQ